MSSDGRMIVKHTSIFNTLGGNEKLRKIILPHRESVLEVPIEIEETGDFLITGSWLIF